MNLEILRKNQGTMNLAKFWIISWIKYFLSYSFCTTIEINHPIYIYQFASLCRSLAALHDNLFVHADLKPANVMWSSYDGCFKLLDFGLTFHTEETDLHQIQSSG